MTNTGEILRACRRQKGWTCSQLAREANFHRPTLYQLELYERLPNLLYFQPYGELGRYLTYYAEDRLYLVFDLWYHGIFFVEAKSPTDAIQKVNCDNLNYLPEVEE